MTEEEREILDAIDPYHHLSMDTYKRSWRVKKNDTYIFFGCREYGSVEKAKEAAIEIVYPPVD